MSNYESMHLIPPTLYRDLMSKTDDTVKSHVHEINVRQLNTFDVNDGGRVTIRNDDKITNPPPISTSQPSG